MTDIRIYRICTLVFTAASNERTRQADASETLADFQDAGLIELIVNQGVGAIDKLPAGIKKDPEAVAETITNNMRKLIIDERATNPKYFDKMTALLLLGHFGCFGPYILQFYRHGSQVQFNPESLQACATGK